MSSVQAGSFLWAALNNVVHWLFHAKKLKNISRNVIGEKGLQTQIGRSYCTHFQKHFVSFGPPVKYTVCFSIVGPYCRK